MAIQGTDRYRKSQQESTEVDENTRDAIDFVKKYGKSILILIMILLVGYAGFAIWKLNKDNTEINAFSLLNNAQDAPSIKAVVDQFPNSAAGPIALLLYAGNEYADGNFQEALTQYARFISAYPEHPLIKQAEVGRIQTMDALGQTEEAEVLYASFIQQNEGYFLVPACVLNRGRCLITLDRQEEARTLYEDFIAGNPGSAWLPIIEGQLQSLNSRS